MMQCDVKKEFSPEYIEFDRRAWVSSCLKRLMPHQDELARLYWLASTDERLEFLHSTGLWLAWKEVRNGGDTLDRMHRRHCGDETADFDFSFFDKLIVDKSKDEYCARTNQLKLKLDTLESPMPVIPFPVPPTQSEAPAIRATKFKWVEPAQIPQRQWLYGRFLIRGQVSLTVAPSGTGKSIQTITEALSLVGNKQLLHDRPHGRAKVWLWNGEDPADELQRRVTSAAIHHRIPPADLEGHLFLDSGRQSPMNIAYQDRDGVMIAVPVFDALVDTIKQNKIDVLHVDPLVSAHSVGENDNNAMDAVVKTFARIADVTGAAIHLVHHPRKTGGVAVAADDARGAGALLAGVRAARTMNAMTMDEAKAAGVESRHSFIRIDDAKANLAPRSDVATWVRIVDVPLGNGPMGIGDSTGVVERWRWPDAMEGVTPSDLEDVQAAVAAGQYRENVQASDWVGKPIAKALGLDLTDAADKAKVRGLVRQWLKSGALVTVMGKDKKGVGRSFVEAGKKIETLPPPPA